MNILVLSDVHGKTGFLDRIPKLPKEYDIVIVAGDLTYFKPIGFAIDVLRKIREKTGRTVYFIPGNCDDPALLGFSEDGLINIHRRVVEYEGFLIYGIGGSNETPFKTWIEWGEKDFEEFLKDLVNVDSRKLIMVTHAPPHGFMDDVNGLNVGSKALRKFLEVRKPLLWLTGHIHEHSGWVKFGETTILNPGPFMKGYYGIVSIEGNEVYVTVGNLKEI